MAGRSFMTIIAVVFRCLLLFSIGFLLVSHSAHAQTQRTGILEGTVTDKTTGEPIPGANVVLAGTKFGAATDSTGRYRISNVPPGDYTIGVKVIGYETAIVGMSVRPYTTVRNDFALTILPIQMRGVEAEAPRAELEREVQISVQELRGAELQLAGSAAQADLFRTIQTLPSVVRSSDFSSELYIRGGSPDQNLVLLDGATIYNPFHFSGFFGAFNSFGIESAELYAGGYPARYGGRASSVLDIKNKVGSRDAYRARLNVDFLSANGSIEGPIPRGSFCLAARHSFRKYLDTLNRSGVYGSRIPPYHFYDLHLKTLTQITSSHQLVLSGYWGDDFMSGYKETRKPANYRTEVQRNLATWLDENTDMILGEAIDVARSVKQEMFNMLRSDFSLDTDWGNRAGSITWKYLPSEKLSYVLTYAHSRFFNRINMTDTSRFPYLFRFHETINDRSWRNELIWTPTKAIQLRAGAQMINYNIDYLLFSPEEKLLPQLFPIEQYALQLKADRRSKEFAGYLETSFDITDQILSNLGIRVTKSEIYPDYNNDVYSYNYFRYSHEIRHFNAGAKWYLDPRFGLKYNPDEYNSFKFAFGIYHQNIFLIPLQSGTNINLINLWFPLDSKYEPLQAIHYILGYTRHLPLGFSCTTELYYKHLLDFMTETDSYIADDPMGFFRKGTGNVLGGEFLLRLTGENTYGWLGYSLSKSTMTTNQGTNVMWFDQRHRINFILHWFSFNRKWESVLSWTYNSGLPYTKIIADVLVSDDDASSILQGFESDQNFKALNLNGPIMNWRYPAYHRMDLQIKRVLFNKPFILNASLWWINVYNHKNIFLYRYQGAYTQADKVSMLPSIPFVGLEAKF